MAGEKFDAAKMPTRLEEMTRQLTCLPKSPHPPRVSHSDHGSKIPTNVVMRQDNP